MAALAALRFLHSLFSGITSLQISRISMYKSSVMSATSSASPCGRNSTFSGVHIGLPFFKGTVAIRVHDLLLSGSLVQGLDVFMRLSTVHSTLPESSTMMPRTIYNQVMLADNRIVYGGTRILYFC